MKTRKQVHINVCPQIFLFQDTDYTSPKPQSFRFLPLGTPRCIRLQFIINRYLTIIFLCLSDQTYERVGQSIIIHVHVCTEVGDILAFVVNCILINNRTSALIKLATCIVNVLT
jgi:hypothetical protein